MKFASSIKDVEYGLPYIGKGVIFIYKDECGFFRISCDGVNYVVSEEVLGETSFFQFDYDTGIKILGDLIAFYIKEGNRKIFYFAIIQRMPAYPIFIYRRDDTYRLKGNSNNVAEICFKPNVYKEKDFRLSLKLDGSHGSISVLSYNICINKGYHMRFKKRRAKSLPRLDTLIKECTYNRNKVIRNELNYIKLTMTDSQIYYSGILNYYENKLINI